MQRKGRRRSHSLRVYILPQFQPCVQWRVEEWQACQATCGIYLVQQRRVVCVPVERNVTREQISQITNADCDPTQQPPTTRNCNLPKCSGEPKVVYGKWVTSKWSECSTSCSVGYRRRAVFCSSTVCREDQKPPQFEHCNLGECKSRTSWQVSPWTNVSLKISTDTDCLVSLWK